MESSKGMKKILFGLLCLLILTLIGLSIFQHLQFKRLSGIVNYKTNATDESSDGKASDVDRVAQNNIPQGAAPVGNLKDSNNIPQDTPPASSLKDSNKNDFDDVEEHLDATEEKLDMAYQKLSDELSKQAEIKEKEEEYHKLLAENTKKRDQDNFITNLDSEYGPLFKELDFSPEKLNELKQLLIDKRAESIEISVETVDGVTWTTISDNEVKAEEYNEKIRQFLGNNDYEKYMTYEESSRERYWVSDFIKSGTTVETITDDQQLALIKSMHESLEGIKDELENYGTPSDSPYEMDEEEIALRMNRIKRRDEAYIEAAKDILSPIQVEQFETYLKEIRDMLESSYKLQAETLGKKATQNDADKKTE